MAKRGKGKGFGGAPADYWEQLKLVHIDFLRKRPNLKAYLDDKGATVVSIHKAVIRAEGEPKYGHVARVLATIRFDGGKLSWDNDDLCAVDDTEKAAIEAELVEIAEYRVKPIKVIDRAPFAGYDPNLIYVYRNAEGGIVFVQVRVLNKTGEKHDFPWTYWNDNAWRMMEPDGLLPLYYADRDGPTVLNPTMVGHHSKHPPIYMGIMLHEGAKTAKYCQRLQADTPEAKAALAALPADWAYYILNYRHIGWPGGAPNPHIVDWSPLRNDAQLHLVLVLDHDPLGEDAAAKISRLLSGRQLDVLRFDQRFPNSFDLSDPFPDADAKSGEPFWEISGGGRKHWSGPRIHDYINPATWITRPVLVDEKQTFALHRSFQDQWVYSVHPPLVVHRRTGRQWLPDEFSALTAPYSDVKDVARLLAKQPSSRAHGITYDPAHPPDILNVDGQDLMNVHRPTTIRPVKGDVAPWIEFMSYFIPNDDARSKLLRWCATLIAAPHRRMVYSVLVMSETQGVGKTTLAEAILAPLVGWWNVSTPSESEVIDGNFNTWLGKVRLISIREIYAGQNKVAYNKLKSVVTDATARINEKFISPYSLPNWAVVYASSNSKFALYMDDEDRRWLVTLANEELKDEAYWDGFYAWLKGDGLGIIYQWAIDFVAEHGAVGAGERAPATDAKEELIDASRSEGADYAFNLGKAAMSLLAERPQMVFRDPDGNGKTLALATTPGRHPMRLAAAGLKPNVKYRLSGRVLDPERIALVVNSDVRAWVAKQRGFTKYERGGTEVADLKADRLEKPLTLRKALLASGMKEAPRVPGSQRETRFMIDGKKQNVVFNFDVPAGVDWPELKDFRRSPEEVLQRLDGTTDWEPPGRPSVSERPAHGGNGAVAGEAGALISDTRKKTPAEGAQPKSGRGGKRPGAGRKRSQADETM